MVNPENRPAKKVASHFYYWSKLLAGKLIVNISVYADESGTHALSGKGDGAHIAVLGGYAGMDSDWVNFCGRWQTTLNDYKVPIFHFSEYADKINSPKRRDWPYKG